LQFSATKQGLSKKTRRLRQQSMKRKRLSTKVLFDRRENPIFRVLNTLGLYIYLPLFINQNKETETRNKGEKKIQNLESFSFFSCILSQTNIGLNESIKRRRTA
jgi:hypothetical protein